jgi:hypothetical protein
MKIKKFNKMAKYRLNVLNEVLLCNLLNIMALFIFIVKELLSTEQKFVDDLKLIIEEVKNPLEN